ncbi:hypothetical protein [Metabacillus niabensis]|nr:hypothetical protein [Metabacillus niabensis]
MNAEWIKLISELEKEGIDAREANRMIRTLQMIEKIMDTTKELQK